MRKAKDRIRPKKVRTATPEEKTRSARQGVCVIFVDTEATEKNYFVGLRAFCGANIRLEKIKKTKNAVEEAQERTLPPNALICLVFDRDEVDSFDRIIAKAEKEGFEVGWSNPCFEIWMHAYFGKMPTAASSKECVGNFADEFKRKTGLEYKKNEPDIFNILERYGSFEKARNLARRKEREAERTYSKPSDRSPSTTVYKLVEKIRGV